VSHPGFERVGIRVLYVHANNIYMYVLIIIKQRYVMCVREEIHR